MRNGEPDRTDSVLETAADSRETGNTLDRVVVPPPWARIARVGLMVAADVAALLLSGAVAYLLWASPVRNQPAGLYLQLMPLVGLFILGYSLFGLYPGLGLGGVETLRRLSVVTAFCFAVIAATTFAFKVPHDYSRMTFGIAAVLSLAAVPVVRVSVLQAARRWGWWPKPVVLVAELCHVERAAAALARSTRSGYRPVGILYLDDNAASSEIGRVPVLGSIDMVSELASRGIQIAVVVTEGTPTPDLLDRLRHHFRHVMMIRTYAEAPVERIQVRNLGGMLCVEYANNLLRPGDRALKRTLDLTVGMVSLILSAPLVLMSLLLVRMTSPGPALYFQNREGLHGVSFRVPKIRTMYQDAEERLDEYLDLNPGLRDDWEAQFKLKNDPRVIPVVGTFLRRFSIDELPQLFSVVAGRMSLVGPRPLPDYHLSSLSEQTQRLRREVRPGVTGLWQVSGRSDATFEEQGARDEYYIRNWTPWLDLHILARTASAVLSGRGAY